MRFTLRVPGAEDIQTSMTSDEISLLIDDVREGASDPNMVASVMLGMLDSVKQQEALGLTELRHHAESPRLIRHLGAAGANARSLLEKVAKLKPKFTPEHEAIFRRTQTLPAETNRLDKRDPLTGPRELDVFRWVEDGVVTIATVTYIGHDTIYTSLVLDGEQQHDRTHRTEWADWSGLVDVQVIHAETAIARWRRPRMRRMERRMKRKNAAQP